MTQLSDFSIYTLLHADDLGRIHEAGGAAERSEKKPWVSGARLFNEATGDGRRMPILNNVLGYQPTRFQPSARGRNSEYVIAACG